MRSRIVQIPPFLRRRAASGLSVRSAAAPAPRTPELLHSPDNLENSPRTNQESGRAKRQPPKNLMCIGFLRVAYVNYRIKPLEIRNFHARPERAGQWEGHRYCYPPPPVKLHKLLRGSYLLLNHMCRIRCLSFYTRPRPRKQAAIIYRTYI